MTKRKSRMFSFVTQTWNPVKGRCLYQCTYCWAQGKKGLITRYKLRDYMGRPKLFLDKIPRFKKDAIVFVSDMLDLFAPNIPNEMIKSIIEKIRDYPNVKFLLLTKNPSRYFNFLDSFPKNVILGATIESDVNYPILSKAPSQQNRLQAMLNIRAKTKLPLFISIEPILEFNLSSFLSSLREISPAMVAVGYDNYWYYNKLKEPTIRKTQQLIVELSKFTKVIIKTLRLAWYQNKNQKTIEEFIGDDS